MSELQQIRNVFQGLDTLHYIKPLLVLMIHHHFKDLYARRKNLNVHLSIWLGCYIAGYRLSGVEIISYLEGYWLFQQYMIEDLPKMISAGLKNIHLRKYH
ncbi:MAG TPA: hypothetical protein VIW25_09445 [Nitrososphaeraceae archaeon]